MEKWLLKLVHLFDFFFRRQQINTAQLYSIVETKLVMDKRRVYMNWKPRSQDENSNHLNMVLGVYALFSLVIAMMILFLPSLVISLIFFHGYIIFMMAMVLITDFSSVILDTTDNQIILPKPISGKTLFMARQVHILLYLLQFTVAMSVIPIICIAVKYSILTGLAAVITVLLSVLLSVFFTYFLYLLILKFSSEKRMKDIITWFQIVMTVFFAVGYQVIPRFINMDEWARVFQLQWYSYFLPPVWMSLTLDAIYNLNFDAIHLLMLLLAVVVPVSLFWLIIRYLAPSFAARLSSMQSEPAVTVSSGSADATSFTISTFLSRLFTKKIITRAGFEQTWKITGRDKTFKLQFYPSLGYIFVFIFIFIFNGGKEVAASWENLHETNKFLWFIYLPMFTVANGILFISFNENFAASWIYHSAPLKKPGEVIMGAITALFVKYFISIYLAMFLFSIYVWGLQVADDFVFGLANDYLCFLILASIGKQYLPFSRQPNNRQQAGRFLLVILQMLIVGVLVGIHFLVLKKPLLLYIMLPIIITACWLMERRIAGIAWKKIAV